MPTTLRKPAAAAVHQWTDTLNHLRELVSKIDELRSQLPTVGDAPTLNMRATRSAVLSHLTADIDSLNTIWNAINNWCRNLTTSIAWRDKLLAVSKELIPRLREEYDIMPLATWRELGRQGTNRLDHPDRLQWQQVESLRRALCCIDHYLCPNPACMEIATKPLIVEVDSTSKVEGRIVQTFKHNRHILACPSCSTKDPATGMYSFISPVRAPDVMVHGVNMFSNVLIELIPGVNWNNAVSLTDTENGITDTNNMVEELLKKRHNVIDFAESLTLAKCYEMLGERLVTPNAAPRPRVAPSPQPC